MEFKPLDPKGKLYLIPTRLGDDVPLEVLPISIKKVLEQVNHYIVENEKPARRFIKKVSPSKSQRSIVIHTVNKYTDISEIPSYLTPCLNGESIGLLSDAGCPGIADPGAEVVKIAHEKGIPVTPLVGPSSILLAMMSSGMNGQNFTFNGYLPIDKNERKSTIKHLEKISLEKNQAQIFIETPYRNDKMFSDLKTILNTNTRLCIACDITLTTEFITTKTVEEWKKEEIDLHKRPTIYIIQRD
ncbi:16S rRNA (cytidine1402-2'-O)-methyltransferase [Aquimarina sp. EL_43]|uniref:SAM-dependent methyltransferase n=1 Tax=unclassified Aquimarina TaxID=2627091 RepID=UPI0018C9F949|nr:MULTISPECIES: SAM-dependent methyltransferase [unclassified Aquimarina]MBG6132068.1 16S rRNA (cytidine1402-2'-O)-methyltransferase [Aquimarina sp. EL_35]MBG6152865.1 16S rRNA (cytidine1402-2'-O)-methyltransferase [Aquimarina sp. EL_32]MBG6170872.1 16S rRNA (cytidine1402-2'-O)-methyltransferase [Aquimarina sp. EL_43]